MSISASEREQLYKRVKHLLGAPIRKIELENEMMDSLLEFGIEDYAQYLQNWLMEHQWSALQGQNFSKQDVAFALISRDFDFDTQFSYAYSKQVGLQTRGPWELKKDYVSIVKNQQIYEIPAGRELNEILWLNPNATEHALWSYYGFGDYGFGGGNAQVPFAGGMGAGGNLGFNGYYVAPAFDVLLRASDFSLKQRILRSDLTYKVTAGPNGTRLLHLMSTPGSRVSFGSGGGGTITLAGTKVWYHYYDTSGMSEEEKNKCLNENKDIVKMPNEVPLTKIKFENLNEPSKVWVRKYFTALCKETLGRVRGKFSGVLKVPDAELTMDYTSLLSEASSEKEKLITELSEYLMRLNSKDQLERKAQEAENLNKSLSYRPLGFYVI